MDELAEHRTARLEAFASENPQPPAGGIVLLGDDLMEGFPATFLETTMPVTNRGIAGETIGCGVTPGLQERVTSSVVTARPSIIFLLVGTSDLANASTDPNEFQTSYALTLRRLKEIAPDARIYVQGIPPFRGELASRNDTIRLMNIRLEGIARNEKVGFIPLHNHMADTKGTLAAELSSDGMRLNEIGYRKWAVILKRYLR